MPRSEAANDGKPPYGEGRTALLDAAIRVVAASGLRGLTYRAVAQDAGVTQGLVAHHFGSWDEMVREALVHAFKGSLERSSLIPVTDLVEDLARNVPEMAEDDAEEQAFQFEMALEARRKPELLGPTRELYDGYHKATRDALERVGADASEDFARLVFAALDGLVFQQLLYGDPQRTRRSLDQLHRLIRLRAAERS